MKLMRDLDAGKLDHLLFDPEKPTVEAPLFTYTDAEPFDVVDWIRRKNIKLGRR